MSGTVATPSVAAALQCGMPGACVAGAMLIDLAPVPGPSPSVAAPSLMLAVVFFWSTRRPDLLPPLALFGLGLGYDLLAGLPLGMTVLSLLLVRFLIDRDWQIARLVLDGPFGWVEFLLVIVAVFALRWLVACLWWGQLVPVASQLPELLLTGAVYPIVAWLLSRI